MSVKFKLGFTVSAETLFTLLSKMLPIDDLSVEEVIEAPPVPERRIRIDLPKPNRIKPVRAPQIRAKSGSGYTLNPDAGINKILLTMLADGQPHHAVEADGALREAGYSAQGMFGVMRRLQRHGYVSQPRKGLWQLTPKKDT